MPSHAALVWVSAALSIEIAATSGYRAAFVEYAPVSPCGSGTCGREQRAASVRDYALLAGQAAAKGAQIIVFPEYGITGFSSSSKSSWYSGEYTETIPVATAKSLPCDETDAFSLAPSVASLSCTARNHSIAIVANLIDYVDGMMYNTDVVLDSTGIYLGKYHKINLFGEGNVDVPTDCSELTFTASFGVTFGVFTCADMMYRFPALDIVAMGVKDFVVPVAWSNEMADMQVLAYAQGWSLHHNVTLIVANQRSDSESGSGVFVAGRPLAFEYQPGSTKGRVAVVQVPREADLHSSIVRNSDSQQRFNLTLLSTSGRGWVFSSLSSGKACSGSICCTVTGDGMDASMDGYALAAFDGIDGEEGTFWAAQVCAVLSCSSPNKSCLTYQQPIGTLRSITVTMEGKIPSSVVPEVYSSGRSEEILLVPGENLAFNTSSSIASLAAKSSQNEILASAIIYARPFNEDSLPYSCPDQGPRPSPSPSPSGACAKCDGGYSCDQWIQSNPSKYSCPELEKDYGCDCSGCRCSPPAPSPGSCQKCRGAYSCDEWIQWDPKKYSCPELEKDYGCDCTGCRCDAADIGHIIIQ